MSWDRQPTRDARFTLERESGEELLSRFIGASTATGEPPLTLVVVVAHPDDEAIGAGGLLRGYPGATNVHLTDGGGAGDATVTRRGFSSRAAYARARHEEVLRALSLVGIRPRRCAVSAFPMAMADAPCRKSRACCSSCSTSSIPTSC